MKAERQNKQLSGDSESNIEQLLQDLEHEVGVISSNDRLDSRDQTKEVSEKKRRYLGRRAFVCLSATLAIASHEALGIAETYQQWSGRPSSILEINEAKDPSNNDLLFDGAVGFGNMDATNMMTALSPLRYQGRTVADRESDKGINTDEQAEKLVEYAVDHNVQEIVLIGHSIGGLKMLNKAARAKEIIEEKNLDIKLRDIVLLQTPFSIDSVRSNMRSFGQNVCNYAEYAPWLKYYWLSRYIPEMLGRKDSYMNTDEHRLDIGKLIETSNDVYEKKIRHPSATANVLYDQFCVQLGATARGAIAKLRKFGDVRISYFRPKDAATDTVVNEDDAEQQFRKVTNYPDIKFDVHHLPNIGHSSPGQEPRAFIHALNTTVVADIAQRRQRQNLFRTCVETAFSTGETTVPECIKIVRPDQQ